MQRFPGGLVFKARRLCASLNSRLESNKDEEDGARTRLAGGGVPGERRPEPRDPRAEQALPVHLPGISKCYGPRKSTLEATQWQIVSQSPTDATFSR